MIECKPQFLKNISYSRMIDVNHLTPNEPTEKEPDLFAIKENKSLNRLKNWTKYIKMINHDFSAWKKRFKLLLTWKDRSSAEYSAMRISKPIQLHMMFWFISKDLSSICP